MLKVRTMKLKCRIFLALCLSMTFIISGVVSCDRARGEKASLYRESTFGISSCLYAPKQVEFNESVDLYGGECGGDYSKPLSYQWYLKSRPQRSEAVLPTTEATYIKFYPDLPGEYQFGFQLTADDEQPPPATATVIVKPASYKSFDSLSAAIIDGEIYLVTAALSDDGERSSIVAFRYDESGQAVEQSPSPLLGWSYAGWDADGMVVPTLIVNEVATDINRRVLVWYISRSNDGDYIGIAGGSELGSLSKISDEPALGPYIVNKKITGITADKMGGEFYSFAAIMNIADGNSTIVKVGSQNGTTINILSNNLLFQSLTADSYQCDSVFSPSLVREVTHFRMYYLGRCSGRTRMLMAEAAQGALNFSRYDAGDGGLFDPPSVENEFSASELKAISVVKTDTGYYLFYLLNNEEGDSFGIGAAFSEDGLSFSNLTDNPIIGGR